MIQPQAVSTSQFARTLRFVGLCCAIFMLLSLAAAAEMGLLWLRGHRYAPRLSLCDASISDLSPSADGNLAVSLARFRRSGVDLASESDIVLYDLSQAQAARLRVEELNPSIAAIGPLRQAVAIGCLDGAVYVCDPVTIGGQRAEKPRRFATLEHGPAMQLRFSPDSELLAAADCQYIHIWRARTGELVQKRKHGAGEHALCLFSRDAESVVCSGKSEQELLVCGSTGGEPRNRFSCEIGIRAAAPSASGRELAILDAANSVRVIRWDSGEELWQRKRQVGDGPFVSFAGDDTELIVGGASGHLCVFNSLTGERRAPLLQSAQVKGFTVTAGAQVIAWDRRGWITVWNLEQRRPVNGFSLLAWGQGQRQSPPHGQRGGLAHHNAVGGRLMVAKAR